MLKLKSKPLTLQENKFFKQRKHKCEGSVVEGEFDLIEK